jgi:hypothetical protein
MRHLNSNGPVKTATALLISLTCLGLAACGSSSSGSSPSASTATTAGTTAAPPGGTSSGATTDASAAAERVHARGAVALIARCMRSHGVDVPEPDAAGNVDLKGIDTNSHQFQALDAKCVKVVLGEHPFK